MTSVLITGPSRNLGRATTLALADRGADLLLVGRNLSPVAAEARERGARVHEITADLSRLADVRAAATAAKDLMDTGTVRPLRALIANAGLMSGDSRRVTADGYETTFAVNHLAHAQLIAGLHGTLTAPARIVLLSSNTYYQNVWRRLLRVPEARWRDPADLARPSDDPPGVAYSNAKLAILYYAHELQRHVAPGIGVTVFEPGWMPGTALGRDAPPAARAVGRALGRLPGISTPERSGPALASVALDDRWSHLRDGAFVLRDHLIQPRPFAHDRARERRLWEATAELLGLDRADQHGGS
ncbi:NAD(P)-dependent dehydrogenase (short-subunit alcohol dehydrogenase family) [Catenuloplanes nepalensis]|uniref:NAD(P)-dependent dehydrogenase (Short-subunit alcohol dehydrogenase family) n=1 Tax=Catenuloplanes nepalensis TaxID=587533 RepID=A0ABT9MU64_9ACTN|nr:SDR family NAD(P)-dependent oxidoreductase [Catenuloplanes nepalensis]MDP9794987.1 NAD(P)-dependent dehydrogenase (short-subunit alcohol dehydrogenase family) [Catenuloplanes nepalensis]